MKLNVILNVYKQQRAVFSVANNEDMQAGSRGVCGQQWPRKVKMQVGGGRCG